MFGIPPPNTPARDIFFSQFWPALWAGILSSILTGIIVGLLLFGWQRFIEERALRRTYAREVSTLREKIREVVAVPDVFKVGQAVDSIPPQAKAAVDALRGAPVSLWLEELPEESVLLKRADHLLKAHASFLSRAAALDLKLAQLARTENGKRRAIAANDATLAAYVFGRLHAIPDDQLALWLDLIGTSIPSWLSEGYEEAKKNAELVQSHADYSKARDELSDALAKLKAEIDA